MKKPHYHVSHLHTGIIDVVLDIHFPARKSQQSDESVAQHGIAEMSDMRGFVGIDAGMLDQNLAGCSIALSFFTFDQGSGQFLAVDIRVDISRARDFEFCKPFHRSDASYDFLCNLAWRFAEFF